MNDVRYLKRKIKELVQNNPRYRYAEIKRSDKDRDPIWVDLAALSWVDARRRVQFMTEETTLTPERIAEAFRMRRVNLIK